MRVHRIVRLVVAAAFLSLSLSSPAHAAMAPTVELVAPADSEAQPRSLEERLVALGIAPDAARERVASLTSQERAHLSARLDQLPVGGDVLGTLAFAALVLLLTDILGYTDVYSFVTRTVNGEKSATGECPPAPAATAANR